MENTVKDIYSEVYAILNMLGKEYINKLPKDIYNIIKEENLFFNGQSIYILLLILQYEP